MKYKSNLPSKRLRTHCVPTLQLRASGRLDFWRFRKLATGLLVWLTTSSFASFLAATADEPKTGKQEIVKWIEDLGSQDYSVRQLATLRLSQQKTESIPFVIQAIDSATGEKADRLFQFLSSIAADPFSESGKLAFDSLNELSASRTTSKSIRAGKILQVIGAEQRDATLGLLDACKAPLRDRELQVMSSSMFVRQPLVIDRKFTGNAADLACLKWLTDVAFVRLEGPQISREILQHVMGMPHLKKLQLVETELYMEDLAVLRDAPDLDLLELVYSPISDESVELLTSLPVWGNVYLFGTKLTQSGHQSLKSKLDGVELFVSRGGFLGVRALGNSTIIEGLVPGGAAERARLQRGDKMLSVNGIPIFLFEDLRKQLANFADGEQVVMEVERNDISQFELQQRFRQGGIPQIEGPKLELSKREKKMIPVTLGRRENIDRDR